MHKHIETARNLLNDVRTKSDESPLEEMTRKREHLDSVNLKLRKLRGAWERAPLEAEEREVGVRALRALSILLEGALDANDPIHALSEFWPGAPDVNHIFGMPPNGGKVWTRDSGEESNPKIFSVIPSKGEKAVASDSKGDEKDEALEDAFEDAFEDMEDDPLREEPPGAILLEDKAQLRGGGDNPYPGKRSDPEFVVVGDVKDPQSGAKTAKSSAGDTNPYPGEMSFPEHIVVGGVKERTAKREEKEKMVDPDDASFDRLDLKAWTEALNGMSLGSWEALLGETGSDTVATWRKGPQELHLEITEKGDTVTHRLLLKEDGMTSALVAVGSPVGKFEPPEDLLKHLFGMQS